MTTAIARDRAEPFQTSVKPEPHPNGNGHDAPSSTPTLELVPLDNLRESSQNTRKHFDQAKLQELSRSIEKSGVLTPLLVRLRHDTSRGGIFEIAAGHRRYRAAQLAGVATVPCIVRLMDDATFLEVLTIENLQREDVHPLEEAQGYKNLLTLECYDIKKIADRVGKSESYVYDRMKLLQLSKAGQKLFLENRFSAGHAILLARLSKDDQERCLAVENENSYGNAIAGGMWQHEGAAHPALGLEDPTGIPADADDPDFGRLKPVSVRELQHWIDKYVRFDERAESVPQLFPETAEKVSAAAAQKAKVIKITRDYHVDPEAKDPDGERTYGPMSWRRADGNVEPDQFGNEEASVACDHSVLAIVAVGEGRGESFQVCIDRKRCTTHWKAEIQERNRRERAKEREASTSPSKKDSAPKEQPWQRDQRLRAEQTKRWKDRWAKGGTAVLEAIAAKLKRLPMDSTGAGGKWLWERSQDGLYGVDDAAKVASKLGIGRGTSAGDWMRHLIMCSLIVELDDDYNDPTDEVQATLDRLKIKVGIKQLLDAANPEPKAAPAKKAKKR